MHQTRGLGIESRGVQKKFSVWDILSQKANPGSKTGTNGPVEPGQKDCFYSSVDYHKIVDRSSLHTHTTTSRKAEGYHLTLALVSSYKTPLLY